MTERWSEFWQPPMWLSAISTVSSESGMFVHEAVSELCLVRATYI